jgi:hypothetical protein
MQVTKKVRLGERRTVTREVFDRLDKPRVVMLFEIP